ncbi:MAG: type II secretion system protein GspD [Gammaproteobacteria bacterium]|nr:type II secretion system protein GspD [Gammaproteobacteria bacterium]MYD00925.1 type II secretion system protein GspD [Gammaproteobacteria bacterium]MYI25019.1 type II secretion system protein GspD [Gammaproteobacteria bacterium]
MQMSPIRKKPVRRWPAAALLLAGAVSAQQDTVRLNYRNTDLQEVVEAVAEATGRNFVIDPLVGADRKVNLFGSQPLSPEAYYQAFLSMLSAHGIVAVPSGPVIRLSPDRTMRILAGAGPESSENDELQTLVLPVTNVDAQGLVPIVRPMMSPGAHVAAHPPTNVLILSDRGSNVNKVARVIGRIDRKNGRPVEVIPLEHASARDVVRVLNEMAVGADTAFNLAVADDRTNSVLLGGEQNRRLELRALVAHLDAPPVEGGDTRVRYLNYADSENLAAQLSAQFQDEGTDDKRVLVTADVATNALIMDAPPATMRQMLSVVDQLDIRRAQVLVEVLIAEVGADRANQLGVNWAAYDPQRVLGSTDFPASGTSLRELVAGSLSGADQGRSVAAEALGPGAGFAVGRVRDDGLSFAALISAVENTAGSNILGTPMVVTLDNQEATINVGQNVPFITGSYASSGINPSSAEGQIRPFTTVGRNDIGLTLTITPRINQGDAVRLEIDQTLSELAPSVAGAVDLVTNTRELKTAVIVEDGGTLVLGGLIQDKIRESRQSVPVLGSLPLIGALFRASGQTREKTNLMLFIRPTILRDSAQADAATNVKYDYLRRQQLAQTFSGGSTQMPELEDAFSLGEEDEDEDKAGTEDADSSDSD